MAAAAEGAVKNVPNPGSHCATVRGHNRKSLSFDAAINVATTS